MEHAAQAILDNIALGIANGAKHLSEPCRIDLAALLFASLNDDAQAKVICRIADLAGKWTAPSATQWYLVGEHLRTCECSTFEGRYMIEQIYGGLSQSDDKERRPDVGRKE